MTPGRHRHFLKSNYYFMDMTNQQMKDAGDAIKKLLPPGQGFGLITFDFGDGLREFRWISNGRREDMLNALEAMLIKWKNQRDTDN